VALSVSNAVVDGETGDRWDGTERSYTTGWLWYRPNYNRYDRAPTTYYESSVLYNEFSSGTVSLAEQAIIDGDRISLVALNGSMGETRSGEVPVDVRPVSSSTRTVAVEAESNSNPVEIRVPTRLSLDAWEELLAGEMVDEGGHVENIETEPLGGYPEADTLVVTLETGVAYDLQLAKAGVGSDVTDEAESYMTDVDGDGASVREEGSIQLVVEVRDAYNNPVSGVQVNGSAEAGKGSLASTTATTDANGRATFRYQAPEITSNLGQTPEITDTVEFSYEVDPNDVAIDPADPEDVDMTVYVQNVEGNQGRGGGGGGNPGQGQGQGN
jgi:hypothetical protein